MKCLDHTGRDVNLQQKQKGKEIYGQDETGNHRQFRTDFRASVGRDSDGLFGLPGPTKLGGERHR